ncbi:MAG: PQQ-binding-like beta-propeller repeat protein [Acidimicrobiales bacterium]
MNDDQRDLPEIHVFVPDAAPEAVPATQPEPTGNRWTRLPNWVPWVAGILLVAGIGALVSATSDGGDAGGDDADDSADDEESADPAAPTATPSPTAGETAEPFFAVRDALTLFVDTVDTGGTAETRVSLLDGSRVTLRHPSGVDDPVAEVRLSAGIWPTGLRDCCRRDVYLSTGSFDDLFGDTTPVVELRSGQPGMGAVFGGTIQILAFSVGDWTVAIAGPPERPFTAAELGLYRDLVEFDVEPGRPPVMRASAPLVVGDAEADISLDADPPVVVNVMDMARRGCTDDGASGAFFVSCVDGFQVLGGRDADPGIESPDVSVDRDITGFASAPAFGTIAGPPPGPGTVYVGRVGIISGGADSGVVTAIDEGTGGVVWATPIGETAFVSPVTVDGTVFASSYRGSLVALDAATGDRRWALLLTDTQGVGPLAAVDTLAPSEPLLVVPTSFDADGDYAPPLVYGVDTATGEVTWKVPLALDVTIGSWAPAVAGDTVVVTGRLAVDNRDAQTITYGITTSGELTWSHLVEPVTTPDDVPITASPSVVFVRDGHTAVDALDATNGELLWRHEADLTVWKVEVDGGVVEIFTIDDGSVRLDQRSGTPVS